MFNPFKKSSNEREVIAAGYNGFIAGLGAGIEMVRIAAVRNEEEEGKFLTLSHVADVMQKTLDEFTEAHFHDTQQ